MDAHIVVQKLNHGQLVQGSTVELFRQEANTGAMEVIKDLAKFFLEAGKIIAAKFGYGTADYQATWQALKEVLTGEDIASEAKGSVKITVDDHPNFDQIEIIFEAWSDDNMKAGTCKTVFKPREALSQGEFKNNGDYRVRYLLNINQLQNGNVYGFCFGAQDDGWYADAAVVSMVDIFFYRPLPVPIIPGPATAGNPVPPAHQVPNITVSTEIAHDYALLSTLMAGYGINLGSAGANASFLKQHYDWALRQSLPNLVSESVRKIRELGRYTQVFPYIYAQLSTEFAKILRGGKPGAPNESIPHLTYARQFINQDRSTERVRNELLRKLYVVLERPITYSAVVQEIPPIDEATMGRIHADIDGMLVQLQRRPAGELIRPRLANRVNLSETRVIRIGNMDIQIGEPMYRTEELEKLEETHDAAPDENRDEDVQTDEQLVPA